jgi:hypothetical protein
MSRVAMDSSTTIASTCELIFADHFPSRISQLTLYLILLSNNGCPECQGKLVAANGDQKFIQFRPRDEHGEENLKQQIAAINQSLLELKNVLQAQTREQNKMAQIVE